MRKSRTATRIDSAGSNGGVNDNPFLYHGGVQDRATGQLKFGTRWYQPTTGTWTQQDSLNAPLDPANANRYQYAADDPIKQSDPTGIFSLKSALGDVVAISSVVVEVSALGACTLVTEGGCGLALLSTGLTFSAVALANG